MANTLSPIYEIFIKKEYSNVNTSNVQQAEVAAGDSLHIRCSLDRSFADAATFSDFRWIRRGIPLTAREKLVSFESVPSGSKLHISEFNVDHEGVYECQTQARNAGAEAKYSTRLRLVMKNMARATLGPGEIPCQGSFKTGFCLNDGLCYKVNGGSEEMGCRCHPQFNGARCAHRVVATPTPSRQQTNALGTVAYGVALLVLMLAVMGIVVHLYRKHKKDKKNKLKSIDLNCEAASFDHSKVPLMSPVVVIERGLSQTLEAISFDLFACPECGWSGYITSPSNSHPHHQTSVETTAIANTDNSTTTTLFQQRSAALGSQTCLPDRIYALKRSMSANTGGYVNPPPIVFTAADSSEGDGCSRCHDAKMNAAADRRKAFQMRSPHAPVHARERRSGVSEAHLDALDEDKLRAESDQQHNGSASPHPTLNRDFHSAPEYPPSPNPVLDGMSFPEDKNDNNIS